MQRPRRVAAAAAAAALLAALAALSLGPRAVAAATTRYVGTPAGGTPSYASVQDAIAAADAGDTIQIAAGTYLGPFEVYKRLSFVGPMKGVPAGPAAAPTGRDVIALTGEARLITTPEIAAGDSGTGDGPWYTVHVYPEAPGTSFDGLTISSSNRTSIWLERAAAAINNCIINGRGEDILAPGTDDNGGVSVEGKGGFTVAGSRLTGGMFGVYVYNGEEHPPLGAFNVSNNFISKVAIGVVSWDLHAVDSTATQTVKGNRITDVSRGIYIKGPKPVITYNTVSGLRFLEEDQAGDKAWLTTAVQSFAIGNGQMDVSSARAAAAEAEAAEVAPGAAKRTRVPPLSKWVYRGAPPKPVSGAARRRAAARAAAAAEAAKVTAKAYTAVVTISWNFINGSAPSDIVQHGIIVEDPFDGIFYNLTNNGIINAKEPVEVTGTTNVDEGCSAVITADATRNYWGSPDNIDWVQVIAAQTPCSTVIFSPWVVAYTSTGVTATGPPGWRPTGVATQGVTSLATMQSNSLGLCVDFFSFMQGAEDTAGTPFTFFCPSDATLNAVATASGFASFQSILARFAALEPGTWEHKAYGIEGYLWRLYLFLKVPALGTRRLEDAVPSGPAPFDTALLKYWSTTTNTWGKGAASAAASPHVARRLGDGDPPQTFHKISVEVGTAGSFAVTAAASNGRGPQSIPIGKKDLLYDINNQGGVVTYDTNDMAFPFVMVHSLGAAATASKKVTAAALTAAMLWPPSTYPTIGRCLAAVGPFSVLGGMLAEGAKDIAEDASVSGTLLAPVDAAWNNLATPPTWADGIVLNTFYPGATGWTTALRLRARALVMAHFLFDTYNPKALVAQMDEYRADGKDVVTWASALMAVGRGWSGDAPQWQEQWFVMKREGAKITAAGVRAYNTSSGDGFDPASPPLAELTVVLDSGATPEDLEAAAIYCGGASVIPVGGEPNAPPPVLPLLPQLVGDPLYDNAPPRPAQRYAFWPDGGVIGKGVATLRANALRATTIPKPKVVARQP